MLYLIVFAILFVISVGISLAVLREKCNDDDSTYFGVFMLCLAGSALWPLVLLIGSLFVGPGFCVYWVSRKIIKKFKLLEE